MDLPSLNLKNETNDKEPCFALCKEKRVMNEKRKCFVT